MYRIRSRAYLVAAVTTVVLFIAERTLYGLATKNDGRGRTSICLSKGNQMSSKSVYLLVNVQPEERS